jgi:hypothetical protein
MKTTFKLLTLILLAGTAFTGCKKDAADPAVDCATSSNRDIEAFFNTIHSQPQYNLYEMMDLTTHEYEFTVSADIQICGIGYKSQSTSLNYDIIIEDVSNNNNVIYSGNHSFDDTQFSYVSIPPVTLTSGNTYRIKRVVINHGGVLANTIGPITRQLDNNGNIIQFVFPVTAGDITIISSNYYGMGGPVPNFGIPNIYFEYIAL